LGGRYDLTFAGQSLYIPGVGLLAGLTLPSGTPPDSAKKPLATDGTGVGTFQGTLGLALEQSFGHWLLNVTGLASKRASRTARGVDATLAPQVTFLVGTAYTFDNEASLAVLVSYTFEGDAAIDGVDVPYSGRRQLYVRLSGVWPIRDDVRLLGGL